MDRRVVEQKLESLRRCLTRIEQKCPASATELANDVDLQDILTVNLTRAVQLCVDIGASLIASLEVPPPNTMGETFEVLAAESLIDTELAARLKRAVGFRNIAVHNYEAINWEIVYAIASDHRDDFTGFARAVARSFGDS